MAHFNISHGIKGEQQHEVTAKDTANAYGSGNVDVFATPAMIALMERTARNSIEGLLPEGFTSVGTEINVRHLKASAVGHIVRCESNVIEVVGAKVLFELQAWDNGKLVGYGTHKRVIVNLEAFMSTSL